MIKFLITNKMRLNHISNTHSLDKQWEIRVRPELTGIPIGPDGDKFLHVVKGGLWLYGAGSSGFTNWIG